MPIYFLWGDEDYLIEKETQKIKKEILAKPGKLTDEEYKEMSKHAIHSANLLRQLGFSDDIIATAFFHHPKNFSQKKLTTIHILMI